MTPPERPVFGPPERPSRAKGDLDVPKRLSRWAMWGCLTLCLSGLLLFAGMALVITGQPNGQRALLNFQETTDCTEHMRALAGALDRYFQDKGKLPPRLADLYPKYLADAGALRCPTDKPNAGTSYRYRPWLAWKKGEDILVYCPRHAAKYHVRFLPSGEDGTLTPVVRQDGFAFDPPMKIDVLEREDAAHRAVSLKK